MVGRPLVGARGCEIHFTVTLEAVQRESAILKQYFDAAWYVELANNPSRNPGFPGAFASSEALPIL